MRRRTLTYVLSLALGAGCGSRSALTVDPPVFHDGGFDAGLDAGTDAGFDAGPPDELVVDCGRRVQFTSPRRPRALSATATSPAGIARQDWALVGSPPGSFARVDPGAPGEVTVTPDVEGDFLMRFTAVDGRMRSASCEVIVRSVVGPPIAICPEEPLATVVGVPVLVVGDGYDDDEVVAYRWAIVTEPPRSGARLSAPEAPVTEFVTPTRGAYVLELTVVDPDMAIGTCQVAITVTGPPEVECPPSPIMAPTRQSLRLRATATDDVGIASERWELLASPPGSAARLRPPDANPTNLVPDRQGRYELRFTAVDVEGLSASCDVTVIGTPTPPTLTCPEVVTTEPLRTVEITASAVDDGMIVTWRWSATSRPPGSRAAEPAPRNAPTTRFTPDIAGVFELTVEVVDDDGMTASCTTRVEAGNVDGLRVEMFWDTNGTDMDLHLMNPTGTRWTSMDDCHFRNCTGGPRLEWGAPGVDDNPRLDIDNTSGFGPENINIERPQPGSYRIAVHNWRGTGPNNTTVRIYCGGSTTTPRETLGPVPLRGASDDLWRVADVEITPGGCRITPIVTADGRPDVRPLRSTENMR